MKTSIPPVVITFAFVCFALVQNAQAVSPAPDGGYPGGNTAEGQTALLSLTTGGFNTAVGFLSLRSNTTNSFNTAVGAGTLLANTADNNTATGAGALLSNTLGEENTATGAFALFSNTEGDFNSANGFFALFSNTTGERNTAMGDDALFSNSTGTSNTAVGTGALLGNTGSNNIAVGFDAGINRTTGDNNIDIGSEGIAGESGTIRIGTSNFQTATFIAGISGATVAGGVTVIVDGAGHLGTIVSSQRFKDGIKPMGNASETILALKPVTFHYRKEFDPKGIPQFGLVAEEVEKVNPALVIRDPEGRPYTMRYEAVNAMLLNEFLKEHKAFIEEQRKVQKQEVTITQLKQDFQSRIAQHEKQIEALTAGLEKVSAQLEASKPAPQVVNNP